MAVRPIPEQNRWFNGRRALTASLLLLGGSLLWSLWPVLAALADRWARDPRYNHGYLVPIFALALLWMRRSRLEGTVPVSSPWGLAAVALGTALQLVGGYYYEVSRTSGIAWLEGLSLLPYLVGVVLLFGGWGFLKWAWPSIAFLGFMVPPPTRVEIALGSLLQSLATTTSTYLLQTLGFMAYAEGNTIQLGEARIGVVDACSGLSMLTTFIALSTAAALVVRRPLVDRFILVASAVPVALLANIARITLTGVLHETVGGLVSSTFYHDLAGWVMIPLAMVVYWIEIVVLSSLFIEIQRDAALPLELPSAHHTASTVPAVGTVRDPRPSDHVSSGRGTGRTGIMTATTSRLSGKDRQ